MILLTPGFDPMCSIDPPNGGPRSGAGSATWQSNNVASVAFFGDQVLDGSEICAGTGTLSRVLRLHGLNVPAMDISYWRNYISSRPLNNNPLDLLGNAGFVHLVCII